MSNDYRIKLWDEKKCLRNTSEEDTETYARLKEYILETLRNRRTPPVIARYLLRIITDQVMFLPARISFLNPALGGPRTLPSESHRYSIYLSDGSRLTVMVKPLARLSERVIEAELAGYYLWYGDMLTHGTTFQLHYKNYPSRLIGSGIIL
jgi:hypothetical protein